MPSRGIMEIAHGIHQIDGINGNCYVIVRDGLTLIDTGLPHGSAQILAYLRDILRKKPPDLSTIILTHFHIDHTGNVFELKKASGAKVAIHYADADYVSGRKARPSPKGVRVLFMRVLGRLFFRSPDFQPDILLADGDIIAGLICIHAPGHTPGSICLLDPGTKVLFSGDLLRYDGVKIEGPPPQFTPDMERAMESVKKIAALDFEILLPGHGVPLKAGASEKARKFARSIQ
jgi:glyoxylase-like metal-dependent hydrolase (beta-lactamase superfamily II)